MAFVIYGRITTAIKNSGIHGLTVEIIDRNLSKNYCLGTTITNANGDYSFQLIADSSHDHLCKGSLQAFILIKDLDEQILYRSEDFTCDPGKKLHMNVPIKSNRLKIARLPRSIEGKNRGVIPETVFGTLERAFEYVTDPHDRASLQALRASFFCPLPPIHEFADIINSAQEVIKGNPKDVIRFKQLLENFYIWKQPNDQNELPLVSEEQAKLLMSGKFLEELIREIHAKSLTSNFKSIIPRENTVMLLAAAILVSDDNPVTLHRNLGIINRQISGLKRVNRLYQSAQNVFLGKEEDRRYFLRTMKYFGDTWGPDDGPPRGPIGPWPNPEPDPFPWPPNPQPRPFPLPDNPEDLERWACTAELVRALRGVQYYSITSISPERACPGDIITIQGTDFVFEGRTGRVVFETEEGTIFVIPELWNSTEIRVRVPAQAICGPIYLSVPGATIIACDMVFDLFRPALFTPVHFKGGKTTVKYLRITGLNGQDCLEPNREFGVAWYACNATSVRLKIMDERGLAITNEVLSSESGVETFTTPNYSRTTSMTATLEVLGSCGNDTRSVNFKVQRAYDLTVDGIEVTQGIQFYNGVAHLTSIQNTSAAPPTNIPIGANNSLQFVANKAAWVRVYVRSGQSPLFESGNLPQVSGILRIERRVEGIWISVGSIPSTNTITAQDSFVSYANERGNLNASLNFNVPAAWMTGLLRLTVNARSPFAFCGNNQASDSVTVNVNLQQTLQLAAIAIGYNGPNLDGTGTIIVGSNVNFAAPNIGAITADTTFTMTTYPVSGNPNIRLINTRNASAPLNGRVPPGGCDPNWGPILALVQNSRNADGNQAGWVYYGFVTPQIPRSHSNVGCAGGNPAGLTGGGLTLAHEVGHQVGLPHAPCGAVGIPNNNYPRYNPYDNGVVNNAGGVQTFTDASIGAFGFNINSQNILNPATAKDFMSYCNPAWISVFTHQFLTNAAGLNPVTIPSGFSTGATLRMGNTIEEEDRLLPLIFSTGLLREDQTVSILSLTRVASRAPYIEGVKTGYVWESIDKEGNIIDRNHLFTLFSVSSYDCDCQQVKKIDPPFYFTSFLRDAQNDRRLQIVINQELIWQLERPKRKPAISKLAAKLNKNDILSLQWQSNIDRRVAMDHWVRYSYDHGKTWNALAIGIKGHKTEIDTSHLPPGKVRFQLVAHDGYFSINKTTNALLIKEKPPIVGILYPKPDELYIKKHTVASMGGSVKWLSNNQPDEEENCVWLINNKEVGKGRDIWVDNPGKGEFTLTFKAKSFGGNSVAKLNITII